MDKKIKTGTLIIVRKTGLQSKRYSAGIYIDNEYMGKLFDGDKQEFEIEAGVHKLRVEQGLRSGEREINIQSSQVNNYSMRSTNADYAAVFFILCAAFINGMYTLPFSLQFLIYFPGLATAVYTYTLGRKAYFIIEPNE